MEARKGKSTVFSDQAETLRGIHETLRGADLTLSRSSSSFRRDAATVDVSCDS